MQFDRRRFVKAAAGGIAAAALNFGGAVKAGNKNRPNMIWIMAEDICPDLGCYGTKGVKTPHLDRMAADGVRYTSAFTTAPVCSPSRSAMMTGVYQTSINSYHHRTQDKKPLPEPIKPITAYLKEAGYYTVAGCGYSNKTDVNFTYNKLFDGDDWKNRKASQPFFAQITLHATHHWYQAETFDKDNPVDPADVDVPAYYPDTPLLRKDWARHLECIQVMDQHVGQILKRLDDEGIADNTIVFFIGDNGGRSIRDKEYLYDGGIHVPLLVRWPGRLKPGTVCDDLVSMIDISAQIIRIAAGSTPGYLHGRAFLEPDTPKREFIVAARDRSGATMDRIRCVRTKTHKYIRNYYPQTPYFMSSNFYKKEFYPAFTQMPILYAAGKLTPQQARFMAGWKPKEELYDLTGDPNEVNNLAESEANQKLLEDLREKLNQWIEQTDDQAGQLEDPAVGAKIFEKEYDYYVQVMQKRGLKPDCSPAEYLAWWEKTMLGK